MSKLPYGIAVLCYLFDGDGRLLLLHRRKQPNQDLYSPIGGKLDRDAGESPTACAVREIREEAGLDVTPAELHLTMYLYEVTRPVEVPRSHVDEGALEWHAVGRIEALSVPQTDRRVIWPLFWRYRHHFFAAHLRCDAGRVVWRIEQPAADVTDWSDGPVI